MDAGDSAGRHPLHDVGVPAHLIAAAAGRGLRSQPRRCVPGHLKRTRLQRRRTS